MFDETGGNMKIENTFSCYREWINTSYGPHYVIECYITNTHRLRMDPTML